MGLSNIIVNVNCPPEILPLGFADEDNFRPIEFHFDSWLARYPGGAFSVIYLRPDGTTLIPVSGVTESPVTWAPGLADMAYEGTGEMQLLYLIPDSVVGLSAVFNTIVGRSLISSENVSTEPTWVQTVTDAAARVELAQARMPIIGENGNWYIWNSETEQYEDSGKPSGASVDPEAIAEAVEQYFVINPITFPVDSVNGKTGVVVLSASDVGALPSSTYIPPDAVWRGEWSSINLYNIGDFVSYNGTLYRCEIPGIGIYPDKEQGWAEWFEIPSSGDIPQSVVQYITQTLTDSQKAQARANIGAASLSDLGTVFNLKGGVATVNDLPTTGNRIGDVWYVENVSAGFIWITSTAYPNGYWEELGETIDLSGYIEKPANPGLNYVLTWNGSAWVAQAVPTELPAVTSADNGKFLRVVSGAWAAETVQTYQGGSY